MSRGTGLGQDRYQQRDFVVATTEEFVKKFGGTRAINKVPTYIYQTFRTKNSLGKLFECTVYIVVAIV